MIKTNQVLWDLLENHSLGRKQLLETLRSSYSNYISDRSKRLADEAFFEPRAFAWISSKTPLLTVTQLLCSEFESDEEVTADEDGVIFLARRGYFRKAIPSTTYDLVVNEKQGPMLLSHGVPAECEFVPCTWIPGTNIEWVSRSDVVLRAFFSKFVDANAPLDVAELSQSNLEMAKLAIDIIGQCAPKFYNLLSRSLRSILLFRRPSCNSFAALGLHGMICLNLSSAPTLGFFIDGCVHQGGHIVFSEATLNRQTFFRVDPDTSLGEVASYEDGRSIYEVLHGLFTEYAVLDVMNHIVKHHAVDDRNEMELRGRMALTLSNMSKDLERVRVCCGGIFSAEGETLLRFFECSQEAFCAECQDSNLDLSGQIDEFDQEQFHLRNTTKS